jgi:hypothetical protein
MAKEPRERIQVGGNLAVIARARKIEPVEPTDPALSFMPPLASVVELTPADITQTTASSPAQGDAPQSSPNPETPKPAKESLPIRTPVEARRSTPRSPKKSTPTPERINKAMSPEYTRVALQLHKDVMTRLFAIALSQNKRYTTLIEDYIMAGLERHKGG